MPRSLALAALAATVLAVPASSAAAPTPDRSPKLFAFASCGELMRYARRNARLHHPTPSVRRDGGPAPLPPATLPTEGDGGATGEPPPAPQGTPAPEPSESDTSPTNVQEAGVDEPDLLKAEGGRIFVLAKGRLHAIAGREATPRLLGSLELGARPSGLLLSGERVLVIAQGDTAVELTLVDVADPAAMHVVGRQEVRGTFVDARQVGQTARVVIRSTPAALDPVRASATLRRQVRGWVPRGVHCRTVRRAAAYAGLDTVAVFTIDLARGLPAADVDAVLSDAQTVYASKGAVYLSTYAADAGATAIHRFDTSAPAATDYASSGEVPGQLLDQFALSEHEGALRVASTTADAPDGETDNRVTVLTEQGDRLGAIGQVTGLGHGERIFGVRFLGDAGYVVTFRQTDPLFTIDLSAPNDPRLRGELQLLGYSAYLHPIADGLLLGLGQDADASGRAKGTQLSLFDVSDPGDPRRLHQAALGPTGSEAEEDHHAFLYWAPARLAFLPARLASGDASLRPGAIGLRVDRERGFTEVGRVFHGPGFDPVRRALVMGDRLFTLSDRSLKASHLEGLGEEAVVGLPGEATPPPPGEPIPVPMPAARATP